MPLTRLVILTALTYVLTVALPLRAQTALQAPAATIVEELAAQFAAGKPTGNILFWNAEQRRHGFAHLDRIYPTRTVPAGATPYPLGSRPRDLSTLEYTVDGRAYRIRDFLQQAASIGLLVVQDGDVLFEYYASGNDANSRWVSFSVTKSVTSLLIGAAIKDGYIESVEEKVIDYLPRLRGSAYDGATIEDVLHMASGVAWDETYADPESDVARAGGLNGIDLQRYLADLPGAAEPGAVFNYNTGETNLAGEILRSAIGNNAATYLSAKVWQPFGMERDATWVLGARDGAELGGCCISATLRDYARIGLFALHEGTLPGGEAILPDEWITRSTSPSAGSDGYGYLWWLFGDGAYAARGIFGQQIRIDPSRKLVIALHSNAPAAVDTPYHAHVEAALEAIRRSLPVVD